MDRRQKTEVIHFQRIMMPLVDIRYTKDLIDEAIKSDLNGNINRAFQESVIISYSRPFSDNDTGNLRSGFIKQFNSLQKNAHNLVIKTLRNQVVAHSSSKAYGVNFTVTEADEVKWVWPFMTRIPLLLDEDTIKLIRENCQIIESWLFDEQTRVKNLLPCGSY
ncbi:hypothetical protein [Colwellia sp. MB3u-55]|uniref:hypothetical protein n=1 Tax=Colwellia sp. MB3u-55 TaxID=2759810 RepID=UPI0015F74ECE|nr:hypothetical protein [Colwellia sp. MB3u-55]MBA6250840.1 hypothetical protein [Colwellia sp. MB3u-55]